DVRDDRLAFVLILNLFILTDDYRDQITRKRTVHLPIPGFCLVRGVSLNADQRPVGNYLILFVDRRKQFAGSFIVWIVVARKPIMICSRFALRPDLPRLIGIRRGLSDKC